MSWLITARFNIKEEEKAAPMKWTVWLKNRSYDFDGF